MTSTSQRKTFHLFVRAAAGLCFAAVPGCAQSPCVALDPVPEPIEHAAAPVNAVFIDLDGTYEWQMFLQEYRVSTVVIQHVVGHSGGHTYDNSIEAKALLDSASAEITIYMGVVYDSAFNSSSASRTELLAAAEEDIRVAQGFWDSLSDGQQARIKGWYLGREIHNFRPTNQVQRGWVHDYLRTATHRLPGPPRVLISPYFVPPIAERPDVLNAEESARLFAFLVNGTGVTDVLLQDGTGARNEDRQKCTWILDDYIPVAAHFAKEIAGGLPHNVEFWSNVEAFGPDSSPERLRRQLSVTPENHPVIVFAYRGCRDVGICQKRDGLVSP